MSASVQFNFSTKDLSQGAVHFIIEVLGVKTIEKPSSGLDNWPPYRDGCLRGGHLIGV